MFHDSVCKSDLAARCFIIRPERLKSLGAIPPFGVLVAYGAAGRRKWIAVAGVQIW